MHSLVVTAADVQLAASSIAEALKAQEACIRKAGQTYQVGSRKMKLFRVTPCQHVLNKPAARKAVPYGTGRLRGL